MDNLDIRTLTKQIAEDNSVQIIEIVKSMSDYQYWEKEHLWMDLNLKWELSKIAFVQSQPIGFIISSLKEGHIAHIHKYAIKQEYRSKGIGSLIQKSFEENIKLNFDFINQITLNIYKENERGIAYHKRNRMVIKSEKETDLGTLILMKLDL